MAKWTVVHLNDQACRMLGDKGYGGQVHRPCCGFGRGIDTRLDLLTTSSVAVDLIASLVQATFQPASMTARPGHNLCIARWISLWITLWTTIAPERLIGPKSNSPPPQSGARWGVSVSLPVPCFT